MRKTAPWITELIASLTKYGADIALLSENIYTINKREVHFQCAEKSSSSTLKEDTLIVREDQFRLRKNQLISRLKSQLGLNSQRIHGRSTKIKEISKITAQKFVDDNHLLGFGGGKTFIGLYYKDKLAAVAIFSKIRLMKYENPVYRSVELERYCSLADTTVTGGLDKLIRYYEKKYSPDDIVTSIDRELSDGSGFVKLGFEKISVTSPLLFAIQKTTFQSRIILEKKDCRPNEYVISNSGNIKLRKWVHKIN